MKSRNQLSSSTVPMYVRSVLLTLMAPLSQLQAFRLAWSLPTLTLLLPETGTDPVPSSNSIHGSISTSGSWDCSGLLFTEAFEEVRAEGTGLLWGGLEFPAWNPEDGKLDCIEARAAEDNSGGWHEMEGGRDRGSTGMAACSRRRIAVGNCMRSKSVCRK